MDLRVGHVGAERAGRVLGRLGAARLSAGLQPPDNVRVALLHDVAPADTPLLRAALERLLQARRLISPQALLDLCTQPEARWRGGAQLAITFDDGLLSSYEATQTVLNPLGLKAAFFVPTAILELRGEEEMRAFCIENVRRGPRPGPECYRVMGARHLLELRDQGHAVFAHTHTHRALAEINTPADIERELRVPRAILEDLLGEPVGALALPFGDDRSVGAVAFRAVRETYDACFTAIPGVNSSRTDRYLLRRDGFHPRDPLEHVVNVNRGALDLPYEIKMWRLRRAAGASGKRI